MLKELILKALKSRCKYWLSASEIKQHIELKYAETFSITAIQSAVKDMFFHAEIQSMYERRGVKKQPVRVYKYKSKTK